MEKQIDMDIKVDRTEWGQKADDLIKIKEDMKKLKDQYAETERELLLLMHKHNQSQILIGGYVLKPKFIESKEKVQIKENL